MSELKIAFVDDDLKCLEIAQDLVEKIRFKNFSSFKFIASWFTDPIEFLNSSDVFDMLFLDYEMKEKTGLEVAEVYLKRHFKVLIFFFSGYKELTEPMQHSYNYELSKGFFFKSDSFEKIEPIVVRYINEMFEQQIIEISHFVITECINKNKPKRRIELTKISVQSINMIESSGKLTYVSTKDGDFETEISLTQWLKQTKSHDLVRVNGSAIINLKHVKSYSTNNITLSTGEEVKLSRNYRDKFINAYDNYLFRSFT